MDADAIASDSGAPPVWEAKAVPTRHRPPDSSPEGYLEERGFLSRIRPGAALVFQRCVVSPRPVRHGVQGPSGVHSERPVRGVARGGNDVSRVLVKLAESR